MTSVVAEKMAGPGSPSLARPDGARRDTMRSDVSPSELIAMPDSQGVALVLAILGAVAFISRRRNKD